MSICYILKSLLVSEYYIQVFYNNARQQRRDNEILDTIITKYEKERKWFSEEAQTWQVELIRLFMALKNISNLLKLLLDFLKIFLN